jgi:hypothetical protein
MLHLLRIFYERALERPDPNGAALPRTDRVVGREQEDTYSPGTDKYSRAWRSYMYKIHLVVSRAPRCVLSKCRFGLGARGANVGGSGANSTRSRGGFLTAAPFYLSADRRWLLRCALLRAVCQGGARCCHVSRRSTGGSILPGERRAEGVRRSPCDRRKLW